MFLRLTRAEENGKYKNILVRKIKNVLQSCAALPTTVVVLDNKIHTITGCNHTALQVKTGFHIIMTKAANTRHLYIIGTKTIIMLVTEY